MTELLKIHPENPQNRLIHQAVKIIQKGGIIAYPTDSAYALGCRIGDKKSLDKIRQIRKLTDKHNFTLVCGNLSNLSLYAKVDNTAFRILKKLTPGAYTFIFEATKEVPSRLQQQKRKTIGLRVPNHKIVSALLSELNEPIMSVSLIMPNEEMPLNDATDILQKLQSKIDLVIDGGSCTSKPTSVLDFSQNEVSLIRQGQGDTDFLDLT